MLTRVARSAAKVSGNRTILSKHVKTKFRSHLRSTYMPNYQLYYRFKTLALIWCKLRTVRNLYCGYRDAWKQQIEEAKAQVVL